MAHKAKRHKGAIKRLHLSGGNKLMRLHSSRTHNLSKKRGSRKRQLARAHEIDAGSRKTINRMLGL